MNQKLKIGVLGAGHLGKIHLRLLQESSAYELVGFYDSQPQIAAKISREFGYRSFSEVDSLLDEVDVIDIVTPTISHFELGKNALEKGLHIFLEKPITATVEEANELVSLAKAKGLLGMVGQVERFNPALMAANPYINTPMFIETHRLAEFNPRGTDVSVVLDLMIHDIDAILSVVQSKVIDVQASGVSIISETPDIANARLRFENGCVAGLSKKQIGRGGNEYADSPEGQAEALRRSLRGNRHDRDGQRCRGNRDQVRADQEGEEEVAVTDRGRTEPRSDRTGPRGE